MMEMFSFVCDKPCYCVQRMLS